MLNGKLLVRTMVGGMLGVALLGLSSAQAASNRLITHECESVEVKIQYFPDVELFFNALPAKSEVIEDSGVRRSFSGSSSHDRMTLTCVVSSEERGGCRFTYNRFSATTDTCDKAPSLYWMTEELSNQIFAQIKFKAGQGGWHFLATNDRLLSLGYQPELPTLTRVALELP